MAILVQIAYIFGSFESCFSHINIDEDVSSFIRRNKKKKNRNRKRKSPKIIKTRTNIMDNQVSIEPTMTFPMQTINSELNKTKIENHNYDGTEFDLHTSTRPNIFMPVDEIIDYIDEPESSTNKTKIDQYYLLWPNEKEELSFQQQTPVAVVDNDGKFITNYYFKQNPSEYNYNNNYYYNY